MSHESLVIIHIVSQTKLIITKLIITNVQLSFMTGIWNFGTFSLAEADAVYNGLSDYIGNDGNLER
jgi:hypothetical protein